MRWRVAKKVIWHPRGHRWVTAMEAWRIWQKRLCASCGHPKGRHGANGRCRDTALVVRMVDRERGIIELEPGSCTCGSKVA